MIKTSTQLKALVNNKAKGDSFKSQILFRHYVMERFLERVSVSKYKEHIIVKGGVLIASLLGVDQRSTLDIDSTLKHMELSKTKLSNIVQEIISIDLGDNIRFRIKSVESIMGDFDYPGMRVSLDARLDRMITPLKLDFSTGDVITPREIHYAYPLMFEDRKISILCYNLETILAEKFETVLSRGILNTRMRDFYDIHMLMNSDLTINVEVLKQAVKRVFENRNTRLEKQDTSLILREVYEDEGMQSMWIDYQDKYDYAKTISWEDVCISVQSLAEKIKLSSYE